MEREPIPDALRQAVMTNLADAPSRVLSLNAPPIRIHICSESTWATNTLVDLFNLYLLEGLDLPDNCENLERVIVRIDPALADGLTRAMRVHEGARTPLLRARWVEASADSLHLAEKWAGAGRTSGACHLGWLDDVPSTTLLVLPGPGPASSRLLLRAIRAIASRMLLQAGWIPLHAASAVVPAGAILLIGRRGGGKTTAMLGMLAAGAGFLANDRVFLAAPQHAEDGAWYARGLPTAVSVRRPTIGLFPPLAALAHEAAELHCENALDGPPPARRRLLIPSAQLAATFRVPVIASATPRAIVVVDYRGNNRPSQWQTLSVADALAFLCSLYPDQWFPDESYEMTRLRDDEHRLRDRHQRQLALLATQMPTALFRPGRDAAANLQRGITDLLG